jgi:hypothetical protein
VITARVLVFIAVICLGFTAWYVYIHPSASYETSGTPSSAVVVKSEGCPSVWDRWTDDLPPASFPESQHVLYEYGPTTPLIKQRACDSSIVGREHVAETWLAGAIISLLAVLFLAKSRLVSTRTLTELRSIRCSAPVNRPAGSESQLPEIVDGSSGQGIDLNPERDIS